MTVWSMPASTLAGASVTEVAVLDRLAAELVFDDELLVVIEDELLVATELELLDVFELVALDVLVDELVELEELVTVGVGVGVVELPPPPPPQADKVIATAPASSVW